MKNYRIIKGKKIHVNQLASMSRQFTVKNTKKGISEVVNHKRYGTKVPKDMIIKSPYSGIEYVMTNPHPIHGEKYGVTVTGYDWVPIDEYKASTGLLWEHKKYPQPKRLHKKYKKKYYFKGVHSQKMYRKVVTQPSTYAEFKNFPYTLPKMNRVQYMEKLVEHKLAKWERKNVCPAEMFTEDVEKWKQERENMKERFRDFVVSIYDKLHLTGRFVVAKDSYTEEKVAEIKDVNGEGHKVNDLPKTSKLIKKAQKITNETKQKRPNLVATNLKDHKKQKGRIILPQAA
jgi:hypothetical protein